MKISKRIDQCRFSLKLTCLIGALSSPSAHAAQQYEIADDVTLRQSYTAQSATSAAACAPVTNQMCPQGVKLMTQILERKTREARAGLELVSIAFALIAAGWCFALVVRACRRLRKSRIARNS